MNKPIIAIDLDNTLCEPVSSSKNVGECYDRKPKRYMIELVKKLKEKGCKIVIFTHRHPVTRHATEQWLEDYDIQYDELVMDKPKYDLLIDDKCFPPYKYLNEEMIIDLAEKISRWNYELGKYESRTDNKKDKNKQIFQR